MRQVEVILSDVILAVGRLSSAHSTYAEKLADDARLRATSVSYMDRYIQNGIPRPPDHERDVRKSMQDVERARQGVIDAEGHLRRLASELKETAAV